MFVEEISFLYPNDFQKMKDKANKSTIAHLEKTKTDTHIASKIFQNILAEFPDFSSMDYSVFDLFKRALFNCKSNKIEGL